MSLVTVAEAKAHLNIDSTDTTYDTELQTFVDATQQVVEDIAGVVVQRTITGEVHDGGTPYVALSYSPVVSITSVVEYHALTGYTLTSQPQGSTTSQYGYELVDSLRGIIVRRDSSGALTPFVAGPKGVVVSYVAGYATTPPAVKLAALELVRDWWNRSQQGFTSADGFGDAPVTSGGYPVGPYAYGLLTSLASSTRKLPGIA